MRTARGPADLAAARRLVRAYGASLGVDLEFQGWTHEVAHLAEEYGAPRGRFLLAFVRGRPVGCVGLRPFRGRICEMKRLYVRPTSRGLGVGRSLAEAVVRSARELGYRRMRLDTLGTMETAMELYRSLGFHDIPPYRFNPIAGARYFELRLDAAPARSSGRRARPPETTDPALRRRRVRTLFDDRALAEWRRYGGSSRRALAGQLRARFLARHLPPGSGWVLELGPGPGRFSPTAAGAGGRVAATDLSLPMLRAARRRLGRARSGARLRWVRATGEHLPFRDRAVRASVVYGNILGFVARDARRLLQEIARVTRPGGRLILDVATPGGATQEFFLAGAERGFLRRVLRDPVRYHLDTVLDTGRQPYDPDGLALFEFGFFTADEATRLLAAAGFTVIDRMAVAPIAFFQERIAAAARRERATWSNLLRIEEKVGRREGMLETGHGFVVAAVRRGTARGGRGLPSATPTIL